MLSSWACIAIRFPPCMPHALSSLLACPLSSFLQHALFFLRATCPLLLAVAALFACRMPSLLPAVAAPTSSPLDRPPLHAQLDTDIINRIAAKNEARAKLSARGVNPDIILPPAPPACTVCNLPRPPPSPSLPPLARCFDDPSYASPWTCAQWTGRVCSGAAAWGVDPALLMFSCPNACADASPVCGSPSRQRRRRLAATEPTAAPLLGRAEADSEELNDRSFSPKHRRRQLGHGTLPVDTWQPSVFDTAELLSLPCNRRHGTQTHALPMRYPCATQPSCAMLHTVAAPCPRCTLRSPYYLLRCCCCVHALTGSPRFRSPPRAGKGRPLESFTWLRFSETTKLISSNLGGQGGRCQDVTWDSGGTTRWYEECDEEHQMGSTPNTPDNMHVLFKDLGTYKDPGER